MTIPIAEAPGVPAAEAKRRVEFLIARRIKPVRIDWLWRMRIPLRGLTVVAGEGGLGKSMLTGAHLTAQITHGTLDGDLAAPRDVLIASAEDDWPAVIVPRLMAAGADLDRVHRITIEDPTGDTLLTFPEDIMRLEARCRELGQEEGHTPALLVIDPVGAFLSEHTDSHRDASVRRSLAPIAIMADKLNLAVIVVAHLNKDDAQKIVNRVNGSVAFGNAARSVLAFARHPDDPQGEQGLERVIVHAKSNWGRYAPTLAARVESRLIDLAEDMRDEVGILVVTGESDIDADDLGRRPDNVDSDDCAEEIASHLMDGPRASREIKKLVGDAMGCSHKTVQRAAMRMRDRDELVVTQGGFPRRTAWELTPLSLPSSLSTPVETPSRPPENGLTTDLALQSQFWPDGTPIGDSGDSEDGARARAYARGDNGHAEFAIPEGWTRYVASTSPGDDDEDF